MIKSLHRLMPALLFFFLLNYGFAVTSSNSTTSNFFVDSHSGETFNKIKEANSIFQEQPIFVDVNPADNSVNVALEEFQISVGNVIPAGYELDESTLVGNVNLFELTAAGEILVPSNVNDTGGGDAVILTPLSLLKENTTYIFRINENVEAHLQGNLSVRLSFQAFDSTFTTGEFDNTGNPGARDLTGVEFTKVTGETELGTGTVGERFSSLAIGPDGKLYASTIGNFTTDGRIYRWDIANDGTLSNLQILAPNLQGASHPTQGNRDNNNRLIIGFAFDPASTANNLIAYVTHSAAVLTDGPEWDGVLTRLSGPNLSQVQDVVVHLPRSTKDHLTNSITFDAAGDMYINQGSNTAGGEPDASWGFRPERLLAGSVLKIELDKLPSSLPLSAYTTDDISIINNAPSSGLTMSDGTYNPYSNQSPITVFASGVRNAYDLVWHSNGWLYVPTNGTAGNNSNNIGLASPNAPATADYITGGVGLARRIDGRTSIPDVPQLIGGETQKDWLFKTQGGSYHGHPNPYRGEFVLNHGGVPYSNIPGQETPNYVDVDKYPNDLNPDPNYRVPAYDFGFNKSPNGVIEYTSNTFNGKLNGILLVTRFSGQDDLLGLETAANGDIINAYNTIPGLGGFDDPLDLVEDTNTGNIYVSEYDRNSDSTPRLTLLRAVTNGAEIAASTDDLLFEASTEAGGTNTASAVITISNNGYATLNISSTNITGAFGSQFNAVSPSGNQTIESGESLDFTVTYAPDLNANNLGYQNAILEFESDDAENPVLEIGLHALKKSNNEPPLQDVVNTLGIGIDVGWTNLNNGTDPAPVGDEVQAELWYKVGSDPVTITPVARYSSPASAAFGWYLNDSGNLTLNEVGVLQDNANNTRTLFPQLSSGSNTFDPSGAVFGFYALANYTEDNLNTGVPHRVRVYPNKNRDGSTIENSYLLTYEVATNGDYQDYMFVIDNVVPFEGSNLNLSFEPNVLEFNTVTAQTNVITKDIVLTGNGGIMASEVTLTASENWVVLPDNFTLGTDMEIGIDPNFLGAGNYSALLTASAPFYTDAVATINLTVTNDALYTYEINFKTQANVADSPNGYIDDVGQPYGLKATDQGALFYGWVEPGTETPASATSSARNRGGDVLLNTFNMLGHFDPNIYPNRDWIIQVPNGSYYVNISVGDPNWVDSVHKIDVNGVNVIDYPEVKFDDGPNNNVFSSAVVSATGGNSGGNLALNKPATQSSVGFGGVPERAVDGNSDGVYNNGSVTHTDQETNAWWRVDLEGTFDIGMINVFNRTDCCSDRLSNATLYAGNVDSTNPNDYTLIGALDADALDSFNNLNIQARYIMVHSASLAILSIAEVEVFESTSNSSNEVPEVFEHCNYDGASSTLGVGSYPNAAAMGISDNSISSVKVPPGFTIQLFQGSNFQGESVTLTADEPCFSPTPENVQNTALVDVTDGVLRMYLGEGGVNTKPNYIRLAPVNREELPPLVDVQLNGNSNSETVFRGPVEIVIEATSQNSSAVSSIQYVLDGATTDYNNAFTISGIGPHDLTVIATDGNGNTTEENFTFTIEEPTGGRLTLENMTKVPGTNRGFPADDYFTFYRIARTPSALSHDTNVMRVRNEGTSFVTISDIVVSDSSQFTHTVFNSSGNEISLPITLLPNEFLDVEIMVIGSTPDAEVGLIIEDIRVISSADNASENVAVLNSGFTPEPGGANELGPQQIIEAFGFQSSMQTVVNEDGTITPPRVLTNIPSSNKPLEDNVNAGYEGDIISSNAFVQANPNQPVIAMMIGAFRGRNSSTARFVGTNGGTTTVGGVNFRYDTDYYQSLLPKDTSGEIAHDQANSITIPFRFMLASRYLTSGGTRANGGNLSLIGLRTYKVIDHNGNIVPNEYIVLYDGVGDNGCPDNGNCDFNDNAYYLINVRPQETPSANSMDNIAAIEGRDFETNISAGFDIGYPGNILTYAISYQGGQIPSWMQFDGETGDLTGTPPSNSAGNYQLNIVATDWNGLTVSNTLTISVQEGVENCNPLASPWQSTDIGPVAFIGSSCFDNGTFSITASGTRIWSTSDELHYAYQELNGNGEIIARLVSQDFASSNAKAGLMIREDSSSNSSFASILAYSNYRGGGEAYAFQYRDSQGGSADGGTVTNLNGGFPQYFRLVRVGNVITGYTSSSNGNWTQVLSRTINMSESVQIGLAVSAYSDSQLHNTVFDNVQIIRDDSDPPALTLNGENTISLLVGEPFNEPGYFAFDENDGDITTEVVVDLGALDTNQAGSYEITYNVSDSAGNAAEQQTRTVNVFVTDETALTNLVLINADSDQVLTTLSNGLQIDINTLPSTNLTIVAEPGLNVESVNFALSGALIANSVESQPPYALFGDDGDGDFTGSTFLLGNYTITVTPYSENGLNGEQGEPLTLSFVLYDSNIIDTTAPELSLLGDNPLALVVGDTFVEPGFTATDDVDGDLSGSVQIGGDTVDTNQVGTYEVTYNVSDQAGNAAVGQTRTVQVFASNAPSLSRLDLINADTDEVVATLQEGLQIDVNTLASTNLSIEAIAGLNVESVGFALSGPINNSRTESSPPYALFGDDGGSDFVGSTFLLGNYTITVTPYSENGLNGEQGGPLTLSFVLYDSNIIDTTAPELSLLGDNPLALVVGDTFVEPGFTATDDVERRP